MSDVKPEKTPREIAEHQLLVEREKRKLEKERAAYGGYTKAEVDEMFGNVPPTGNEEKDAAARQRRIWSWLR